jgi:hypothetical protein
MRPVGPDKAYWAQVTSRAAVLDWESDDERSIASMEDERSSRADIYKLVINNIDPDIHDQMRRKSPTALEPVIDADVTASLGRDSMRTDKILNKFCVQSSRKPFSKRLSSRVGSVTARHDAVQGHYYGATSNFHLTSNTLQSASLYPLSFPSRENDSSLANAGLSWIPDHDYEENLLNFFFTWHNPAVHAVKRSLYEKGRQHFMAGKTNPFFSPSLANAMLALGAAFAAERSHPSIPRTTRISDFFALRARTVLEKELDNPTLATIQALLLLSHHEAAEARDSRGQSIISSPHQGNDIS